MVVGRAYIQDPFGCGGCLRTNKVLVNGSYVKPSREMRVGDTVTVKKMPVVYSYRVVALVSSRQPAKEVPNYAENLTPQEELDKLVRSEIDDFCATRSGDGASDQAGTS